MKTVTPTVRFARALGLTALIGLTVAGASAPMATQAANNPVPRAHRGGLVTSQQYTIVALAAGTPNTITVVDTFHGNAQYTVSLSPNATVVRRYNGKSAFSELSVKDVVTLAPLKAITAAAPTATTPVTSTAPVSGTSVLVTRVKDFSIQMAYTQVTGKVLANSGTQISLQLTATKGHNVAAFQIGQTIAVNVSATTPVTSGKTAKTLADLQPGTIVRTWGLSDAANGVLTAKSLHIVPLKAAAQTDSAPNTGDGGAK